MTGKQRIDAVENFNNFVIPNEEKVPTLLCKRKDAENKQVDLSSVKLTNVPESITSDMCREAEELIKTNGILKGFGSTYLVKNEKKPNDAFVVTLDGKKNNLSCVKEKCFRYKSYQVCSHMLGVASLLNLLETVVQGCNKKKQKKISALVDFNKDKTVGKKPTKATQRRKSAAHKPKTPLTKLVESDTFLTNQNKRNQSIEEHVKIVTPDPEPRTFHLFLLKICHGNVKTCYGCGKRFSESGQPEEPNDLVVITKIKRKFVHKATKEVTRSTEMAKVYCHFSGDCLKFDDQIFKVEDLEISDEVARLLSSCHKAALNAAGVLI